MATKEEAYRAVLDDLTILWAVMKAAARSWKESPKQQLRVISLPISAAINKTVKTIDSNIKSVKTGTGILVSIRERLLFLQKQLLMSPAPIGNPTELLDSCQISLRNIASDVLAETMDARPLLIELGKKRAA